MPVEKNTEQSIDAEASTQINCAEDSKSSDEQSKIAVDEAETLSSNVLRKDNASSMNVHPEELQELEGVVKGFYDVYESMIHLQNKYTTRTSQKVDERTPLETLRSEDSPVKKLKSMVSEMKQVVTGLGDGLLSYENKLTWLKKEVKFFKKHNDDLMKSENKRDLVDTVEFEYMENLLANSLKREEAEEKCKKIEECLKTRNREIRNLRNDIVKKSNCPIDVVSEYNELKEEREAMETQIKELMADASEAADRREKIDDVNRKLKKEIGKLRFQIKLLGGDCMVTPKEMYKPAKLNAEEQKQSMNDKEVGNVLTKSSLDSATQTNDQEGQLGEDKLDLAKSKPGFLRKNAVRIKGMDGLLKDVAHKLHGENDDALKAVRFYYNSDLVAKEIGRLESNFALSSLDAKSSFKGVTCKKIGRKANLPELKTSSIENDICRVTSITEETYTAEETAFKHGNEAVVEEEACKDVEAIGDVIVILGRQAQ